MGIFITILIIVALAFGVWWNHRNANLAQEGVSFVLPFPPSVVADAIHRTHNQGTKAAIRNAMGGMTVTPLGPTGFATSTKYGDNGEIAIARDPAGSLVSAKALSLYVGSHPKTHNLRFSALTHRIYCVLGITPFAAKFNRWNRGLEGRITRTIARSNA